MFRIRNPWLDVFKGSLTVSVEIAVLVTQLVRHTDSIVKEGFCIDLLHDLFLNQSVSVDLVDVRVNGRDLIRIVSGGKTIGLRTCKHVICRIQLRDWFNLSPCEGKSNHEKWYSYHLN